MQTSMFVFAGVQRRESPETLDLLLENLNRVFAGLQIPVAFTRKDKLLTARFNNVSYYVTVFSDENEVKDFYQMARDAELSAKPNPISEKILEQRFQTKRVKSPDLYKDADYSAAKCIYTELAVLDLSSVYLFF